MEPPIEESDWIDNWFVLRSYHSAQPEGTAEQWREVIAAMRKREGCRFKRVAVWFCENGWANLTSPRNSVRESEEIIPPQHIDEWCDACEPVLDLAQGMLADGAGI